MSVGFESQPEPEFDPMAERALLLQEVQDLYRNNGNTTAVVWGSRGMTAVIAGSAMLAGEAGGAEPTEVRIANIVEVSGNAYVTIKLGTGDKQRKIRRHLKGEGIEANANTAGQDAHLRRVLGRTVFTMAAAQRYANSITHSHGERLVLPSAVYNGRPYLENYRDFFRYLTDNPQEE